MSATDKIVAELMGKDLTLARDYAGIINWSIPMIEKWTDEWTDYTITDPGILFLNADAYQYDMIHYSLDKAYVDNILRYTDSVRSLYFMAALVGVDLPDYVAASATITVKNNSKYNVSFPEGFQLYLKDKATKEEVWFSFIDKLDSNAGVWDDIEVLESRLQTFATRYSAFDEHQMFHIPLRNIASNACRVWCRKDNTWKELKRVDDALLSILKEPSFSVHRSYNATSIKLSPGVRKYLKGDAEIIIRYGTSSGVKGNVGEIFMTSKDRILTEDGEDITDLFEFNIEYGHGGSSPLSMEDERVYIGDNSWRTNTLIASLDFETLALNNFNGDVIRFVYLQNCGEEKARLFFLPKENLRPERISELYGEIYEKASPLLFCFTTMKVFEMDYYPLSFELEITLSTNVSNLQLIKDEIDKLFREYFDRETQPAAFLVKRVDIISMIETLHEVEFVTCLSPIADMRAGSTEIFTYGGSSIKFIQGGD